MAERSEANSAKQSFASKYYIKIFLTRSFASRFKLRFAQPFLAKFKWTINWSLSPQGLMSYVSTLFFFEFILQLWFSLLTLEKILTRKKKKKARQNGAEKSTAAIPTATKKLTTPPEPAKLPPRPSPIAIRTRTTMPTRKRRSLATRIRIRACLSEKITQISRKLFKLPRIKFKEKTILNS